MIEKGIKDDDYIGHATIKYNDIEVGFSQKGNTPLKNHYMITSFEKDEKVLRELETNGTLSNDYRDGINYSTSNLNEPNPTTNPLKTQDLSPLEQANAEKLAKLESERLESEKEFSRLKEQEIARKAALKKKLEHERGNAGNIESQTKIEVGEDIPTHTQAQIPKSRVRLNEREIYDLNYAIVKAKDLKPSFTTGGTQKRTDMNEEQIKSIAQNFDPKKIFGLAEMSMPFQFTKNFFTGNAKRASEIIETTLSKEQQEALKEFSAQFGGETQINANNAKDFLRDKIKSVFKGDESKLKAYDKVKEILTLDNHKEQQQAFIRAIRSDETGNTLAFLIEAANLSPKANANLKSILNQTTENLTKSLKPFDLKDYEIKSVFDNLEQGTKESYDKALNEIIGKLYDDSYKVNLRESVQDATNFEKFLNDLRAQGEIDPQAKSFLRQIEENVYNPNGVTYEQLKNSRQLINAYLRNVKDPSTLGYIQKASANFLKNDIDNAIESLLKQNKSAYEKISELQKSAINDYREMKQALELVDKAKIRDKHTHESDAINSLMKIIKGQGQKDLTNYQALTKGLQESDKERLELSMLNRLMEQSLKQDESLKVFDSAHFFNKLNEFKNDVFTTPAAKEYIDIASGFHKLFKNDAKIADSLKPATTKNLNQGLATTLSGALKYQWTKFTLGTLYRNAPDRILGVKLPKALNEATAGAALKYHIKRALERSHTISDFSKQLELSAKNSKFTNNTLKIIEELNNGVKQASEEIKEKARDFSNEKLTNEQIKELLNNTEIPTSGRDAITFGTNNLNPEMVEFLHKNNKKMIIEKANNKELELLKDANFKHPENIRASLDHDAIDHILKRHGVNSVNVKNREIPITNEDIANYRYIVNNADAILRTLDKYDKEAITAFKQINGYAVVVEQAINKKNELVLKTMYKSKGDYKNNEVYKEFSSTSLNANAKVRHRLSSYSGATENPTKKPLTSQEDLLKTQENPLKTSENLNQTTQEAKNLSPLEQA
ncbi:DUF3519 domain-containing protein, partial [Helicobacter pylori]|uniref:DUF3519 domain-containing protein n=1 Tax=Helicobacter pylori TaxID=210 RepID=UPI001F099FA0